MKNYFAVNLRFLRKMNSMTQENLAAVMSKRHTTIGNWEKNISKPNIEELITLANYFNVDVNTILLKDMSSSQDTIIAQDKKIEIESDSEAPAVLPSNNDLAHQLIDSLKISIQALQQVISSKSAEIEFLRGNDFHNKGN